MVGVAPGAAWRAALEAATEVGAGAFVLADLPNTLTQRRLADAMLAECGSRLLAAAGLLGCAVAVAAGTALLPDAGEMALVAAAAAGAAALAWPVLAPLSEIDKLAGKWGKWLLGACLVFDHVTCPVHLQRFILHYQIPVHVLQPCAVYCCTHLLHVLTMSNTSPKISHEKDPSLLL